MTGLTGFNFTRISPKNCFRLLFDHLFFFIMQRLQMKYNKLFLEISNFKEQPDSVAKTANDAMSKKTKSNEWHCSRIQVLLFFGTRSLSRTRSTSKCILILLLRIRIESLQKQTEQKQRSLTVEATRLQRNVPVQSHTK